MKAKEVKPNDPLVYTTISGFYNRQGDFPEDHRGAEHRRRARTEEPSGLPAARDLLLGEGLQGSPPDVSAAEGIHREGAGGDRQGAGAQSRLRRRVDLQEPAAPHGRQRRDRPGEARRALQAGGRTAQQGDRSQQSASVRQAPSPSRPHSTLRSPSKAVRDARTAFSFARYFAARMLSVMTPTREIPAPLAASITPTTRP